MKKVVLFCSGTTERTHPYYGDNGDLHQEIERKLGEKIRFAGYVDCLEGEREEQFVSECMDADVVLLDAWNYSKEWRWDKNFWSLASIANRIKSRNPGVWIFAQMFNDKKCNVHAFATPVNSFAFPTMGLVANYLGGKIERDGFERRYFLRSARRCFNELGPEQRECYGDELVIRATPHDTPKGTFMWVKKDSENRDQVWEHGEIVEMQETANSFIVHGIFHGKQKTCGGTLLMSSDYYDATPYTIRFAFECSLEKTLAC